MKRYLTIVFILGSVVIYGQAFKGRDTLGLAYAKQFLSHFPSVSDSTRFFYKNPRHKHLCLLSDSATAVNVAMPILTKAYGQKEIAKWKPFEVYLISNYWFISGTKKKQQLPKGVSVVGGDPFIMVLDAFNSKVLYMTAGE
jgi:hypothetical protein